MIDAARLDRLVAALERARPKGDPVIVTGQNPVKAIGRLNQRVYVGDQTAVYVEVYLNGVSSITLVVEGAASEQGPTLTLPDSSATQTLTAAGAFVVPAGSQWVAINVPAVTATGQGATIVVTPFSPSSSNTVTVSGTSSTNIAQVAGVAIGAANPVPVSEADGSNAAIGAVGDTAVTTNAVGTLSGKLRGLVALLASAISITFGWIRTQAQPATFNLVGTSGANAAQTVTQAAAGAGVRNYLSGMTVSWSGGAPAAGTKVEVKDNATVIWTGYVGQAGATQGSNDFEFTAPLQSTANTALNVVVDAAGAGVTTKVSAQGTTGP